VQRQVERQKSNTRNTPTSHAKQRAAGIDFDDGSGDAMSEARQIAGGLFTGAAAGAHTLLSNTLDPEVVKEGWVVCVLCVGGVHFVCSEVER
jgi:hypothetical protein